MKNRWQTLGLLCVCLLFLAAACRTASVGSQPLDPNLETESDTITMPGSKPFGQESVAAPVNEAPTAAPITEPLLTLTGGEDVTVTADFTFTDPGFSAIDLHGNDITDRVSVTGELTSYLVGDYELTYSVTDDEGRTTVVTRQVHVVPYELPEIVMPPEKTVYLTFDDGPCSYTEQLLNVLKKYDAKATFFVIGNKARKEFIGQAYREGHSIGVHSYTHKTKEIYKSEETFFEDFLKTQEVIKEQTGSYTRLFRFPGGSGNTVSHYNEGIMTRLTKIMEDMGYRYFDWNVSAGDSSKGYTQDSVRKKIINGMKNHSDFVITLQHDIHLDSVRAVEAILKWGTENGYTFRALDLTSPIVHSKLQN